MNWHTSAGRHSRMLAIEILILSSVMCSTAGAAEKLWGSENLLSGPKLTAGDTVTVSLTRRAQTEPKSTAATKPGSQTAPACKSCMLPELSARVVKVLPNGNLVLEARARLGEGSILIGGEAARIDVSVERKVHVGRLSNLAVVARRVDTEKLSGILRCMNGARVAAGRSRTANGKPKK